MKMHSYTCIYILPNFKVLYNAKACNRGDTRGKNMLLLEYDLKKCLNLRYM